MLRVLSLPYGGGATAADLFPFRRSGAGQAGSSAKAVVRLTRRIKHGGGRIMGILDVLVALYIATTVFALVMTYREQKASGRTSPVLQVMGFLACTAWPFVALACLVSRKAQVG